VHHIYPLKPFFHLFPTPTGKERLYYEERKRKNHKIGDRTAEKA
jgi:hypothetical protein